MSFSTKARIDNYAFKEFEMPLNQMRGAHTELADLPELLAVRQDEFDS